MNQEDLRSGLTGELKTGKDPTSSVKCFIDAALLSAGREVGNFPFHIKFSGIA
jgi:hypothetical protein